MITTFLINIIATIINIITSISNSIAGGWSVWPSTLLDGLTYFFSLLMKLDFILNIQQLFLALKFLIAFEIVYYTAKLLIRFFNWVRGAGPIEV